MPRDTSWRNRAHSNVHGECKSVTVASTSIPTVGHAGVRPRLPIQPTWPTEHPSIGQVLVLAFATNRAEPVGLV